MLITAGANTPPTIDPIPAEQFLNEGETLELQVTAQDPDLSNTLLTYELEPGSHFGAAIDRYSGRFTWTPDETRGPGEYAITVRVWDDGAPRMSSTTTFNVTVGEVNSLPGIQPIPNQEAFEGHPFVLQVGLELEGLPPHGLLQETWYGTPLGDENALLSDPTFPGSPGSNASLH